MNQYQIPNNLKDEINGLAQLVEEYKNDEIDESIFKPKRVLFGIYEQRERQTYMIRFRLPGGVVTPEQLTAFADISSELNRGYINLTTRGGIQIHTIQLADIINSLNRLLEFSLSSRGGGGNTLRNIVMPADAGVDKDEVFDVTPYGVALTSRFVAESDSWALPRKYKIAFTGNPNKGLTAVNDVGFTAQIKDGVKGFRVTVAGGMGARSTTANLLFDFVKDDQVYYIAKAIKRLFDKYGNRRNKHQARLRVLWAKLGEADFIAKFQEEYRDALSQYSPLELPVEQEIIRKLPENILSISETEDYKSWVSQYVTEAKNGFYNIEIPIFMGTLNNGLAKKIASLVANIGEDIIRVNTHQNLLLRAIPKEYFGEIYQLFQEEIKFKSNEYFLSRMACCTGAATCKLGVCLSRNLTQNIATHLNNNNIDLNELGDSNIMISGCPNNCGQHSIADVGLFGRVGRKNGNLYPSYFVMAGGDIYKEKPELSKPIGSLHAKYVPQFLEKLIGLFQSENGEFSSFREFLRQGDPEKIKAIIASFPEIPTIEQDPSFYTDWDTDDPFVFMERKGQDECSASLFDLIETDFKTVKELEQQIETTDQLTKDLQQIIFLNSRALLISQRIEVSKPTEVFEHFKTHFFGQELFPSEFKEIIDLASNGNGGTHLAGKKEKILQFSKVSKKLYDSMDETLRFAKPKSKSIESEVGGFKISVQI